MTASLRTLTTALDEQALGGFALSSPTDLLTSDAFCWLRRGEGLLGFGEITEFSATGPQRFADAEVWWKSLLENAHIVDPVRAPGTGALALGSFAFSKTSPHASVLVVPAIAVGFHQGSAWITQLTLDGSSPTPERAHAMLREFLAAEVGRRTAGNGSGESEKAVVRAGSLSEEGWKQAVSDAVVRIAEGHGEDGTLEKVVLARDVVAKLDAEVDRVGVLRNLVERYDECWTYGVRGLVGATPEMLIKVEGTTASARVLAGTLDREDEPLGSVDFAARVLGGSDKQRQEHDFAVRSLTRQLAPFAKDLSVPAEPFILELPNVWHLASDVSAELADVDRRVPTSLALVEALHPTAAVCGTPREEAGKLILELEQMDRGPYAGPVGWLDGAGNGEWGIALRGAVIEDPHTVRLYAGAGIVEASVPEAELAETWAKLRPMLQALGLSK